MNKYGGKEMRSFAKSTRYDWLVNYIPEPIKKTLGNAKDKIMSLFKTNTTEDCIKPTHVSNVYRGEKKPSKPKIKKIRRQHNVDVRNNQRFENLFEQEEKCYSKPVKGR